MSDRVGQHIGNYRLIRSLGQGGFAEVYLGEHLRLNTLAAIKILHTSLEDDDVESFLREAQTVARLKHPHIVRVFDFDVENRTPFLVMDYLPNGNVRRFHPKGSPLPLATILSYVTQLASALQYAHDEKLIHRDIKPENMLLDRDNTLVLSDFGIAIMAQSSRYQSTQQVAGTAAYMAPEQFQGKPRRASDQYSLGIVVYEWLTGERPFHGSFTETASQHLFVPPPPLREKVPTISPDVEQVVLTSLAKDPEQRFGSVQAFANALQQASQSRLSDHVQQTPPDPPMTAGVFPPIRLSNQTDPLMSSFQRSQPPVRATSSRLPNRDAAAFSSMPFLRKAAPFVLVLLLLLVSGFGVFQAASHRIFDSSATAQLHATTTAEARATAVVTDANATATAVNATSTVQAAATATTLQQIYTQATSGTPAISDPLSDDRNNWGLFTTNWGGQCAFTGGAYHLTLSKPGYVLFCNCANLANLNNFNNYALQVQLTIEQGNEGGIVFDQTANGAYRIDISSAGTFIFYQHTPGLKTLQDGSSSAIRTGSNQTNVLTVILHNGNFYFYVNGQFVTSYSNFDANNKGGGDLAAQSDNQATNAAFSNLKIWTL